MPIFHQEEPWSLLCTGTPIFSDVPENPPPYWQGFLLPVWLPSSKKPKSQEQTCVWERQQNTLHWHSSQEHFSSKHPSKSDRSCTQLATLYTLLHIKELILTPKFLLKLTKHILYNSFYGTNGQESWKTNEDGHKEVAEMEKMRSQGQWPQKVKDRRNERQWNPVDSTVWESKKKVPKLRNFQSPR